MSKTKIGVKSENTKAARRKDRMGDQRCTESGQGGKSAREKTLIYEPWKIQRKEERSKISCEKSKREILEEIWWKHERKLQGQSKIVVRDTKTAENQKVLQY